MEHLSDTMANPFNHEKDYDDDKGDFTSSYMFYPDDAKFFAELLAKEWSLEGPAQCDRTPNIIYNVSLNATRDNSNGGSILVSQSNLQRPQIRSIAYESVKQTRTINIDIQNPLERDRNFVWVREVGRILRKYRSSAGKDLNGWDYMELPDIQERPNYTNFYHTIVSVKLVRELVDLE